MIVCLCKGVSDRDIASAIEGGASSVDEIAACTGAGTGCGRCRKGLARSVAMAQGRVAKPRIILPIVAAIVLSLLSFFWGTGSKIQDSMGLWQGTSDGAPFWTVFAVFFPAVTGIMAGPGRLPMPTS